ncbi:angio-associated migratory cell protein-like [Teleopsis dalmanni]|uniref:angio-associated migratory cell protein-like n=1 Tax=Teleopsis dalmanni TaxID=139649 RepID=UPI0018CFC8B5|nr:angio-associated migratory cell protein-like [Teleopsis dalmanni]
MRSNIPKGCEDFDFKEALQFIVDEEEENVEDDHIEDGDGEDNDEESDEEDNGEDNDGEDNEEQFIEELELDENATSFTFNNHIFEITVCALHPHRKMAITTDGEDRVFLWDTVHAQVVQTVLFHRDKIIYLEFCHDGTYLAIGYIDGELFVFKVLPPPVSQPEDCIPHSVHLQKVWQKSTSLLVWLRWHHTAYVLFAGDYTGEVFIFDIQNCDVKLLPREDETSKNGQISHDGKKLLLSYDSKIKLFDIETYKVLWVVKTNTLHKAIACSKYHATYISGGFDGQVNFFNDTGIHGIAQVNGDILFFAFSPSSHSKLVAVCSYLYEESGTRSQITVWDCTTHSLCTSFYIPSRENILCMEWISDYVLLTSTISGDFIAYNLQSASKILTLKGDGVPIYFFKYKKNEHIILTALDNGHAKICEVPMQLITYLMN